jgi:hypothetical protein
LRHYFGDLAQDLLNEDDEIKELFNDKFVCLKNYLNTIKFDGNVEEKLDFEENEYKNMLALKDFLKNIYPTCKNRVNYY